MKWRCKRFGHKWVRRSDQNGRRYHLDHCKRCPALRIFDTTTGKEYADS